MSIRVTHQAQNWLGLMLDTPRRACENGTLREILGNESIVVVVRDSQPALEAVREILHAGATNVLTVMGDAHAPTLVPLLRAVSALASLKRVVVLHDASSETAALYESSGILMLRDSLEVRDALRALVDREAGLLRRVQPGVRDVHVLDDRVPPITAIPA